MVRTDTPARGTRVPDVRKGDQVLILTGKDGGKKGVVDRLVRPDRVVVGGLNVAKRHTKPRTVQGRSENAPRIQQGGILDLSLPIHVSNLMVVCPACGRPTRIKHARLADGRSARICVHCSEPLTREAGA